MHRHLIPAMLLLAALTAVNGKVYSAIAADIKNQSPLNNMVFITLANGRSNSGYLPNDAPYGTYTSQVLGSRLEPGCAETTIPSALTEMIKRYMQEPLTR